MTRKKVVTVVVIVAVLLGGIFVWKSCSGASKKDQLQLESVVVEKGSISTSITATGNIKPIKQVEVGTQVSGRIEKIYVDFNSKVKKGQLLAELDKINLKSALREAQASYDNAVSEQKYLTKTYERQKKLFEEKMISESEFDEIEYKMANSRNNVIQRQSDLNRAQTNLSYAEIYSPIDGVVLSRDVDEGQTVASSMSTPTLFIIAQDLKKMQVEANIDEADIGNVKEGLPVSFSVDAFPTDTFEGVVTQVRLNATVTSNVVTYTVVIEAENPDQKLMPGMTANITIYTMKVDDVLIVPIKATRFDPTSIPPTMFAEPPHFEGEGEEAGKNPPVLPKGTKVVWVKEGEKIHPQPIEIGITDGTCYQVTKGLKGGEEVIVSASQIEENISAKSTNAESPFMPKRGNRKR